MKRPYFVIRDLHLYLGLFISPFALAYAVSVFFLVHSFIPGARPESAASIRSVVGLPLPFDVEALSGRDRIDALRPALGAAGVRGEVGFIQHFPKDQRLVVPVTVPGRETSVDIDLQARSATVRERTTGISDALIVLHKAPGPHLAAIRRNWIYMRIWSWLADATVYLLLFITISGLYLWFALRSERVTGTVLLAAGALSFIGIVYAISH